MSFDVTGASAASVTGAIRRAAQKTGASFHYLLATARVESNLNPTARASSSSAGGLFQFLEQTWLGTLKHAGPAHGYGRYADAISTNASGRFEVRDPTLREQILNLRNDPSANALMAGAFTQWNGEWLASRLGRAPTEGELYLAHFLGAGGASRLITLAKTSPQASAAEVFPRAAGANRAVFYNKQGEPRSVGQVYDLMVGRYGVARAKMPGAPAVALAAQSAAPASGVVGTSAQPKLGQRLWSVPLPALAALPVAVPPSGKADGAPVFHNLFHTSERRDAVAPVVSSLWRSHAVLAPSPPPEAGAKNPSAPPNLLKLFSDSG